VFQPTHPHGVRHGIQHRIIPRPHVSTHAPARGATASLYVAAYCAAVSTHAPARGATRRSALSRCAPRVSTHAPARGATYCLSFVLWYLHCFNPRTRTGCDVIPMSFWIVEKIVSTHAPARGATYSPGLVCRTFLVSTHAPARGATLFDGLQGRVLSGFNPRTRTGCDLRLARTFPEPCLVSTHAPARGATGEGAGDCSWHRVSTHAPARGATFAASLSLGPSVFQPTHPHGVRPDRPERIQSSMKFQPTHPHGVRRIRGTCESGEPAFQPTHPHGVRHFDGFIR